MSRHRFRRFSLVSLAVLATIAAGLQSAGAADSPGDELKLTTDRVIVFKDGYYMAIKSGTAVTSKDGELQLLDVPDNAVLGSVWATSSRGKILSMVASRDEVRKVEEKAVPCTQTIEVLQANIGQKAKVVTHDKVTWQGEIIRVLSEPTLVAPTPVIGELFHLANDAEFAMPSARSARRPGLAGTTVSGITGSQFVLRTDDGDILLQVSQIQSLNIKDMKTTIARTVTSTSNPKRLTLRFAEAGKPVDVAFMYFQPGLRWIPTYRVNLPGPDKKVANLDLQAEFLNEAEDLVDVPVDIVVGVPNFRFKETPSPLILEQTLRNVLQQAAPQLMSQQLSNSTFQMRSGERFGQQVEGNAVPFALPPELGASGSQDLFVYNIKKLKLMKGQRAAMSLITAQVPCRDVYTWDVHVTRQDIEAASAPSRNASPQVLSENRVWHQIVLSNTTTVPWTTGAVLLMQGHQPLAQDLLTYTSVGSEVRIPVTISVDTQGMYAEEETGRKLNAMSFEGVKYAQIDKTMTLNLVNRKATPIPVEITFRTGGKADEATNDGKITLNSHSPADWTDYRGHSAVNNSSRVVWKGTVKPGETFSPSVKYHYFARH